MSAPSQAPGAPSDGGPTDDTTLPPGYVADLSARTLADVIVACTAVSESDRRRKRLSYRGIDVAQLAGQATFEEVIFLLQRGELPRADQLAEHRAALAAARSLDDVAGLTPEVARLLLGGPDPLAALRVWLDVVGQHGKRPARTGPEGDVREAVAILGQLAAGVAALAAGGEPVPGSAATGQGTAELVLTQLRTAAQQPPPSTEQVSALDQALVVQADQGVPASTFAVRLAAAAGADLHGAIVAGLTTMAAPLRISGVVAVLTVLDEAAGSPPEAAPDVVARLTRGQRVAGFGHRAYRGEDPRATLLRGVAGTLAPPDDPFLALVDAVEAEALATRGLAPNVSFAAAVVYRLLGIPPRLAGPLTALARSAGWTAHALEQHRDNRLIRPSGEYVGRRDRPFVPLGDR
ncbi:MAG: 2-methylcitrate synthase/citrate synthase [Mycobacterium sp.]|nr:2-methylcitrate synthase/citrate synthase [Mycobacterium sp.]